MSTQVPNHPMAPPRCPHCECPIPASLNYGVPGSSRWLCHGCAASLIQHRDLLVLALSQLLAGIVPESVKAREVAYSTVERSRLLFLCDALLASPEQATALLAIASAGQLSPRYAGELAMLRQFIGQPLLLQAAACDLKTRC